MSPSLSHLSALDAIDALIKETALAATQMAVAIPGQFDAIGAGSGVGVRLKALEDAYNAVVTAGLKAHEAAAA